MSILDGLRPSIADTYTLDRMRGTEAWRLALDNFQKALRNPTDEQMVAMCRAVALTEGDERAMSNGQVVFIYSPIVRAVLAAAGGDQ